MAKMQADSVQGVVFLEPNAPQDDAMKVWSVLFPGDSPDGFQKGTTGPSLETTATGERDGHSWTIRSQVGRIDVILTGSMSTLLPMLGSGPPKIPDLVEAVNTVADRVKKVAKTTTPIRVSIVLDMSQRIQAGSETSVISALVHPMVLPQTATDVSLQLNVLRPFASAPNIGMNRLIVINSGQMGYIQAGPNGIVNNPMVMTPFVGMRVDVNSDQRQRVDPAFVPVMMDELALEALKLSDSGMAGFN